MPNTGYVPFFHHLVQIISDVPFPTTKKALCCFAGESRIPVSSGKDMGLNDLFALLVPEDYPCATALYCALASTIEKHGL